MPTPLASSIVRIAMVVLPILAVGGCLVVVATSANRGIEASSGLADPSHYRIDDLSCEVVAGMPTASATILNTDDEVRRFQVRLVVSDLDVPDKPAVRSEYPTLDPGRSASFDGVALGWPHGGSPPAFEPASCEVQVYNAD